MTEQVQTESEEHTMAVGRNLAGRLRPGSVITLSGDLGAGKTRFAKGVAQGMGLRPEEVDSPTFTLLQEYRAPDGRMLYHFDFYRLNAPKEALEIGTEEYFYGDGISIVEWPERAESLIPEDAIRIRIAFSGPQSRTISIDYPTSKAVP